MFLPVGALLQADRYRIDSVLGQGGFAITYHARDLPLDRVVAIKELFPAGLVARYGTSVHPLHRPDDFTALRKRFRDEGRTLAMFDDVGIVRVLTTFEENGTAYIVSASTRRVDRC